MGNTNLDKMIKFLINIKCHVGTTGDKEIDKAEREGWQLTYDFINKMREDGK